MLPLRVGVGACVLLALVSVVSSVALAASVDRWVTGSALVAAAVIVTVTRPLVPDRPGWLAVKVVVASGCLASGFSSLAFGF